MPIYYSESLDDYNKNKKGFKRLKVKDYAKKWIRQQKKMYTDKGEFPIYFLELQFRNSITSHCDGYSVVVRFLDEQGHIVFDPEYIENIHNIYLTNEENREFRKVQLQDKTNTIKQVLGIICDQKHFSDPLKHPNKMIQQDFNQTSVIGHSFGDSTAYALAQTEKEFSRKQNDDLEQKIMEEVLQFAKLVIISKIYSIRSIQNDGNKANGRSNQREGLNYTKQCKND